MKLSTAPLLPDVQARIEEIRDRVMAKIDEIRSRIGGSIPNSRLLTGGLLKKGKLRIPALKNLRLGVLAKPKSTGRPISRRFLSTGPRIHVSDFWGDSHTLSGEEIRALPMNSGLTAPMQKDQVPVGAVAPKVLNK